MKGKAPTQGRSSPPPARPLYQKAAGRGAAPGSGAGWHSWGCSGRTARAVMGWAIESESN